MNSIFYPLFCILPCFPAGSKPGTVETIISFGDSSYKTGNINIAIQEYRRAFFFADQELKCELGEKIADSYFVLQDFSIARIFYDSAIFFSGPDISQADLSLKRILCSMMDQDFGFALLQLNNLQTAGSSIIENKKNLYQGICCFGMGLYDESFQHFMSSVPLTDTLIRSQLLQVFKNRNKLKRPYPSVAVILSILLPGSGQVYSGDLRDGLNSFLLTGGLFYLGISNSLVNPYVILPFSYRYYTGGIVHAKQKAEEKRKVNQSIIYANLMEILLK